MRMFLNKEFLKKCEIVLQKKFESKKNNVYVVKSVKGDNVDGYFVLKQYTSTPSFEKESGLLISLKKHSVSVPELVYKRKNIVIMEYLPGKTLFEVLDDLEKRNGSLYDIKETANSLCRWLKSFYCAAERICGGRIILKDVNLRNFLVVKNNIYGVDFEDCGEGHIEEDAGKFCAYMLTYLPPFTPWKITAAREFFNRFVSKLGLDEETVEEEIRRELEAIEARRGLTLPRDVIERIRV